MICKNCPVLKHFQTKINAAGKYLVLERAGIFMQKEESAAYQHLITIFSDDQARTDGSRGFLECNSSPDKKIPLFFTLYKYIIQYTQSHGVNICSFGVIKLQNPNLHLSSYILPLSQPFNP